VSLAPSFKCPEEWPACLLICLCTVFVIDLEVPIFVLRMHVEHKRLHFVESTDLCVIIDVLFLSHTLFSDDITSGFFIYCR